MSLELLALGKLQGFQKLCFRNQGQRPIFMPSISQVVKEIETVKWGGWKQGSVWMGDEVYDQMREDLDEWLKLTI